jgi:hypothetical protein
MGVGIGRRSESARGQRDGQKRNCGKDRLPHCTLSFMCSVRDGFGCVVDSRPSLARLHCNAALTGRTYRRERTGEVSRFTSPRQSFRGTYGLILTVMAGPVPAIRSGTLPRRMAGTSPAMTEGTSGDGRSLVRTVGISRCRASSSPLRARERSVRQPAGSARPSPRSVVACERWRRRSATRCFSARSMASC